MVQKLAHATSSTPLRSALFALALAAGVCLGSTAAHAADLPTGLQTQDGSSTTAGPLVPAPTSPTFGVTVPTH